jgi:glycosyltransferase involved in cell wall biosynthesis
MVAQPKISVIIPARNEERYIGGALDQLSLQDCSNVYEVIVVDNGSSDGTADKAVSFGAEVVREDRKGTQFARETGRKKAKGEILAYLDADCIPPRNWLKNGAAYFDDAAIAGVSGPYDYYDAKFFYRLFSGIIHRRIFPYLHYLIHDALQAGAMMIGGNAFLKAEAMERIGGFDTSIAFYGDDADTGCRLAASGRLLFKNNLIVKSSARRFQALTIWIRSQGARRAL